MPGPIDPMRDRRARLRRTARAVRSGVRRYPSALLDSLIEPRRAAAAAAREGVDRPQLDSEHAVALAWLGHAGLLARLGKTSFAVDPVLSSRIGPTMFGKTFGLRRLDDAPVRAEQLKGVNVLLITHAHFDHLDKPTLRAMASPDTWVITADRCASLIPRGFGQVDELRCGREIEVNGIRLSAIEPRHWGARTILDRSRGACSFLARHDDSRVLFAGDTAETDVYRDHGPVDLAAFGIGAYDPWEHMHATPEQVWKMFEGLEGRYLLPIHHSTFELSDEPIGEPMSRLVEAAGGARSRILEATPGTVVVVEDPSALAADGGAEPEVREKSA